MMTHQSPFQETLMATGTRFKRAPVAYQQVMQIYNRKQKSPSSFLKGLLLYVSSNYTLISTSTPLGNSSFINASTVFALFE